MEGLLQGSSCSSTTCLGARPRARELFSSQDCSPWWRFFGPSLLCINKEGLVKKGLVLVLTLGGHLCMNFCGFSAWSAWCSMLEMRSQAVLTRNLLPFDSCGFSPAQSLMSPAGLAERAGREGGQSKASEGHSYACAPFSLPFITPASIPL